MGYGGDPLLTFAKASVGKTLQQPYLKTFNPLPMSPKIYLPFVVFFVFLFQMGYTQIELLNEPAESYRYLTPTLDLPETPAGGSGELMLLLDQTFDSLTALSPVKGFNAALILPDGSVWKRATGVSQELPTSVTLETEDLMGMGSISKSFVSTTILVLFEEGLLSLDDSIGMYLDDYPNVPGEATIKQLLGHRTGISDYLNENPAMIDLWVNHPDTLLPADTILYHYVLEPNFPVGNDWSYSNTNYLLAGKIIENITGQPWYEVVRNRIIDPMGLTHTLSYPFETPGSQNVSHCWLDYDGNGEVEDLQGSGVTMDGFFNIGNSAGCLLSTPEDIASFHQQLYGGSFLQPATLEEMQTDYANDPSGFIYGLGTLNWPVFGMENWGHDGNIIYRSVAHHFPDENISYAIQQNDIRFGNNIIDIYDIAFELLNAYLNYSPSTSTEALTHADAFQLFPNPATDQLVIELEGPAPEMGNLAVFTPQGQLVLTDRLTPGTTQQTINLLGMAQGLYLLQIEQGAGKTIKPFMVAQ
jgi:D-alanyl-D-alanine carboxypeptidase